MLTFYIKHFYNFKLTDVGVSLQRAQLCGGARLDLKVVILCFHPTASLAFCCQPWRANIFILFPLLYVTAPDCWDNIFTFFCIFGILLRRAGDPRGRRRLQPCITLPGRWTGKLPWNCPLSLSPLLPIAPSPLHLSTESKILASDLSENTQRAAIVYDGREASNYEWNQAWNAPISCFRPCLMVKINYTMQVT